MPEFQTFRFPHKKNILENEPSSDSLSLNDQENEGN